MDGVESGQAEVLVAEVGCRPLTGLTAALAHVGEREMDHRAAAIPAYPHEMPVIGSSPTNSFDVLLHQNTKIAADSGAMVATVTVPPGDPGSGPHRHSGPVFGYVLEGEILFELEGEEPYPIEAGQAFWEPGFDVVHYQAANLRDDISSRFVVFMLCAPDVPMMDFLDAEEIDARAHLRHPSVRP
jgi:quercetin dioxygenase-like cupin family protein